VTVFTNFPEQYERTAVKHLIFAYALIVISSVSSPTVLSRRPSQQLVESQRALAVAEQRANEAETARLDAEAAALGAAAAARDEHAKAVAALDAQVCVFVCKTLGRCALNHTRSYSQWRKPQKYQLSDRVSADMICPRCSFVS
jgi:hypothetical protein